MLSWEELDKEEKEYSIGNKTLSWEELAATEEPSEFKLTHEMMMSPRTNVISGADVVNVVKNIPSLGKGFIVHGKEMPPRLYGGMLRYAGGMLERLVEGDSTILKENPYSKYFQSYLEDRKLYKDNPRTAPDWWQTIDKEIEEFLTAGSEKLDERGKEILKESLARIQSHPWFPSGTDEVERFMYDLGAGGASLGTALLVSILTKSPTAAAIMFGAYQAGETYHEAKEAGESTESALNIATIAGVAEATLEFLGLDFMFKRFPGMNRILSTAIHSMSEAGQEFSQELVNNIIVKSTFNTEQDLWEGVARAATIGGILGGGASVALDRFQADNNIKLTDEEKDFIEDKIEKAMNATQDDINESLELANEDEQLIREIDSRLQQQIEMEKKTTPSGIEAKREQIAKEEATVPKPELEKPKPPMSRLEEERRRIEPKPVEFTEEQKKAFSEKYNVPVEKVTYEMLAEESRRIEPKPPEVTIPQPDTSQISPQEQGEIPAPTRRIDPKDPFFIEVSQTGFNTIAPKDTTIKSSEAPITKSRFKIKAKEIVDIYVPKETSENIKKNIDETIEAIFPKRIDIKPPEVEVLKQEIIEAVTDEINNEIEIYHFSPRKIDVVDPFFMGENLTRAEKERQQNDPNSVPTSAFYTRESIPEIKVAAGSTLYKVKIDKSKLVDIRLPENKKYITYKNNIEGNINEAKIKEDGYSGYIIPLPDMRIQVRIVEPIKVQEVGAVKGSAKEGDFSKPMWNIKMKIEPKFPNITVTQKTIGAEETRPTKPEEPSPPSGKMPDDIAAQIMEEANIPIGTKESEKIAERNIAVERAKADKVMERLQKQTPAKKAEKNQDIKSKWNDFGKDDNKATMTAFIEKTDDGRVLTREENLERNEIAKNWIRRHFPNIEISEDFKGSYDKNSEVSFMLTNVTPRQARYIGRVLGQQSILTSEGLIGLNPREGEDVTGKILPAISKDIKWGKEAEETGYFSVIEDENGNQIAVTYPTKEWTADNWRRDFKKLTRSEIESADYYREQLFPTLPAPMPEGAVPIEPGETGPTEPSGETSERGQLPEEKVEKERKSEIQPEKEIMEDYPKTGKEKTRTISKRIADFIALQTQQGLSEDELEHYTTADLLEIAQRAIVYVENNYEQAKNYLLTGEINGKPMLPADSQGRILPGAVFNAFINVATKSGDRATLTRMAKNSFISELASFYGLQTKAFDSMGQYDYVSAYKTIKDTKKKWAKKRNPNIDKTIKKETENIGGFLGVSSKSLNKKLKEEVVQGQPLQEGHELDSDLAEELIRRVDLPDSDPQKIRLDVLADMYSEDRRAWFRETFAPYIKDKTRLEEKAYDANWFFESKILLKDVKSGLMRWWHKLVLPKSVKKDIFMKITNIKNEDLFNPVSKKAFLKDLAEHTLGVAVTESESRQIWNLAQDVMEKREIMGNNPRRNPAKHEDMTPTERDYGLAVVKFKNYMADLKQEARKLKFIEHLHPKNYGKIVSGLAGISKTMKATWDMSNLFRQSLKLFWSSPKTWFKNAGLMMVDVVKTAGGKNMMDEISASIYSHPQYGEMVKDKLDVATVEEEMVGSATIEKIPILGWLQKMSDVAYTGMAYRNRVALYEHYSNMAKNLGHEETTGLGIGRVCNAMTGRSTLGPLEHSAEAINKFMFAPRLLTANVRFLTAHIGDQQVSGMMKKEAAKNLLKNIAGMATVFALNGIFNPDGHEEDPRSSDFGKIRIGNTRFDYTGGMGPLVVLAARQVTGYTKQSTTGIIKKLDTFEYGVQDRLDVVYDFFENKWAPLTSQIKEIALGRTFDGDKTTPWSVFKGLFVPIIVEQGFENRTDPYAADTMLAIIAEGVGINVTTYSFCSEHWETKTSDEMKQFKWLYGEKETKRAGEAFNYLMNEWFHDIKDLEVYRNMSSEDKEKMITKKKRLVKEYIFSRYGFKATRINSKSGDNLIDTLINYKGE